MRILSIDPGGNTGLCVISLANGKVKVEAWDTISDNTQFDWIKYIDKHIPHVLVMESMVAHGKLTRGKIDQIKAMGIVEWIAYRKHVSPIEYITPEERGRINKVPADIKGDHARDAYRVGVAYAVKKGRIAPNAPDLISSTR